MFNPHRRALRIAALAALLGVAGGARADVLQALQTLRAGGCDAPATAAPPLRRDARLDYAAALWASGQRTSQAVDRSGYPAQSTTALHLSGPESAAAGLLRGTDCRSLTDPQLRDVGVYRRGPQTWLLLASRYSPPSQSQAPQVVDRVLTLVNAARARGARCGSHVLGPVAPLRPSRTLDQVAAGHAEDMAEYAYLEHRDRAGRTPADRVRAVGYREQRVGENIAYGPTSPEEVVQGWLHSPGHCENIMDEHFVEMGLSYAPARSVRHELYWVQVLADPRI